MQTYKNSETFFAVFSLILGTLADMEETWAEDAKLVRRLKAGDRSAFAELVEKYQESLYTTCYCILWNQEDAEDAASEAFIRSFENIRDLRDTRKYYGWLKQIAVNYCNAMLKERKKAVGESPEKGSWAQSPNTLIEEKEIVQAVGKALDDLSADDREIVILKHFCELKFDEVARRLGLPVNTTKTRFYRALEKLAGKLEYLKE